MSEEILFKYRLLQVNIQKVCFGYYMDRKDRELITALVKLTAPEAELVQLQRKQLDKPLDMFQ